MKINPQIFMQIDKLNNKFKQKKLIVSEEVKQLILENANKEKKLLTFKIYSENQAQKVLGIKIEKIAKYYLFKKYKNYEYAQKIFQNLILFSNSSFKNKIKNSSSQKLKNFYKIYLELKENQLILEKPIDSVEIIDAEIDWINQKDVIEYRFNVLNTNNQLEINRYKNYEEEIFSTFTMIQELIDKGIKKENIVIYAPSNYHSLINVLISNFHLDIEKKVEYKIFNNENIKNLIIDIEKYGFERALVGGSQYYNIVDIVWIKIIDLCNDYRSVLEEEKFIDFFRKEINNIKIISGVINEGIKLQTINKFIYNNKNYNFILGVDNLNFFKYAKDIEYLTDKEKQQVGITTSIEKNNLKKERIENIFNYSRLNKQKNIISYSRKIKNKELEIYNYLDNILIKEKSYFDFSKRYSKSVDNYYYKGKKELLKKYNVISNEYLKLEKNIVYFKNKSYNPQMIDTLNFKFNKFKEESKISATMLDSYYKCPFVFYLERILKVNRVVTNEVNLNIGTYIHYILENMVNNNFDIYIKENESAQSIINYQNIQEEINKLKNHYLVENKFLNGINKIRKSQILTIIDEFLLEIVGQLIIQIKMEKFEIEAVEKTITYQEKDYTITGKIDLILRNNNNFIVIDYKTGNNADLKISNKELENGLNLQNLLYFILLQKKYGIENVNFAGTYRIKIKPELKDNNIKYHNINNSYYQELVKRKGYTNKDEYYQNLIDLENYQNLKLRKDGEYDKRSRIWTIEEFIEKLAITQKKINKFIDNLENKKEFKIEPLKSGNNLQCEYCPYKNICYHKKNFTKEI